VLRVYDKPVPTGWSMKSMLAAWCHECGLTLIWSSLSPSNRNGPSSRNKPSMLEQPGPPLSHTKSGAGAAPWWLLWWPSCWCASCSISQ